ncbi:cystathionine gamma-synthase [Syncephalis fuscata]|nr:cystathionine gamma-synthase [Syncephalis fuscata]
MAHRALNPEDLDISTLALHGDTLNSAAAGLQPDLHVSPALSLTTTAELQDSELPPGTHIYSRYSQPVRDRAEAVIAKINQGGNKHKQLRFTSVFAALFHYQPKRIAIREAYFGSHKVIGLIQRFRDTPKIDIDDEFAEGDLVWLETPVNPTGEVYDIRHYADKIHRVGGKLVIDATFAPPPLQYPFDHGADLIMHSATKYFGGHSDLLSGVLITKDKKVADQLYADRGVLGNTMGSLESWLLLRSIRTLDLRVRQQSSIAFDLVAWLNNASGGVAHDGIPADVVHSIRHSSLQFGDNPPEWVKKQHPGGHTPVFSILLKTQEHARLLPHRLQLSANATSLGGVESLVEWRYGTDGISDPRLVRASVGLESLEDQKRDWRQALQLLASEVKQ